MVDIKSIDNSISIIINIIFYFKGVLLAMDTNQAQLNHGFKGSNMVMHAPHGQSREVTSSDNELFQPQNVDNRASTARSTNRASTASTKSNWRQIATGLSYVSAIIAAILLVVTIVYAIRDLHTAQLGAVVGSTILFVGAGVLLNIIGRMPKNDHYHKSYNQILGS